MPAPERARECGSHSRMTVEAYTRRRSAREHLRRPIAAPRRGMATVNSLSNGCEVTHAKQRNATFPASRAPHRPNLARPLAKWRLPQRGLSQQLPTKMRRQSRVTKLRTRRYGRGKTRENRERLTRATEAWASKQAGHRVPCPAWGSQAVILIESFLACEMDRNERLSVTLARLCRRGRET